MLVFCVWVCTHEWEYPRSPEEGDKSQGARVIDSYRLSNIKCWELE